MNIPVITTQFVEGGTLEGLESENHRYEWPFLLKIPSKLPVDHEVFFKDM